VKIHPKKGVLYTISFMIILFLVITGACKKKKNVPTAPDTSLILDLSGTITLNGQALINVDVYLSWGASQKTSTGSDGRFKFSSLLSADYVVTPSRLGYAFNPSNYEVNQTKSNLDFEAQPATVGSKLGEIATDFTARDQNRQNVSLYDFFGKVILINLSADWCGPCRQEAGHLGTLFNQYKDRDFQIITILTSGDPLTWAKEYNLTFPVLDDNNKTIWNIYGEGFVPLNIVVDHNCLIRYKKAGYSESEIKSIIEKYL